MQFVQIPEHKQRSSFVFTSFSKHVELRKDMLLLWISLLQVAALQLPTRNQQCGVSGRAWFSVVAASVPFFVSPLHHGSR